MKQGSYMRCGKNKIIDIGNEEFYSSCVPSEGGILTDWGNNYNWQDSMQTDCN